MLSSVEADDAAAVCLHDEVAAEDVAVLELVGHLLLEVEDVVEALLLHVPYVEDAGVLFRADAYGDEHLVLDDASPLADVVRGEARVDVLDAVVVEGVLGVQVHDGSVAEARHAEDHRAPAVALAHVLHRVAVADEEPLLAVYHPLQGVAVESVGVVEDNGLHEFGRFCEGDALHEADVLQSPVALLGALRHVEERELVGLVVAFCAEEGHVGVVLGSVAGEGELPEQLEAVGMEAVDGGKAGVLQADEQVAADSHALIALAFDAAEVVDLLHGGVGEIKWFAGCQQQECQ